MPASDLTQCYRLGDFDFRLKGSDPVLREQIGSLLPGCPSKPGVELPLIDIDLPLGIVPNWREIVAEAIGLELIRLIVRLALNHHHGYLWIDAATLMSPAGKLVLIAGPSHAGKSTAATALAFGYGWKIFAEDITLVNPKTSKVIAFASPISLRKTSVERIESATGVVPGPVIGSAWVPMANHACDEPIDFKVGLAAVLSFTDPGIDDELDASASSSSNFIHSLLPLCNALHLENGISLLDNAFAAAHCYRIAGGSLSERLEFIARNVGDENLPEAETIRRK